jgi:hypothetical protein
MSKSDFVKDYRPGDSPVTGLKLVEKIPTAENRCRALGCGGGVLYRHPRGVKQQFRQRKVNLFQ